MSARNGTTYELWRKRQHQAASLIHGPVPEDGFAGPKEYAQAQDSNVAPDDVLIVVQTTWEPAEARDQTLWVYKAKLTKVEIVEETQH